jgi:hypothetical protein
VLPEANEVFAPNGENEFGKPGKTQEDPSKFLFLDFTSISLLSGVSLFFNANNLVSSSDGSVERFILTHLLTSLLSTPGFTKYYIISGIGSYKWKFYLAESIL